MNRHFVFRNYWWIALLAGGGAVALALAYGGHARSTLIGTIVAGALAFCHFVQQQKLAEMEMFHKLFTSFTARYSQYNGPLAQVPSQGELSPQQRDLVVDYFNLCAEEYLFYRKGYIPREVWRSWCRGMLGYIRRPPFDRIWQAEVETQTFYGLSLEAIEAGAA